MVGSLYLRLERNSKEPFSLILQRSGEVQSKLEKKGKPEPANDEEEEEDEHGDTLCGICGGLYGANEFWIGCDHCDKW